MSHDEYAVEPIRGLPERPPEGEHIIWQGRPTWQGLAVRAFHARKIAIYFVLVWCGFAAYDAGRGDYAAMAEHAWRLAIPAVLALAVVSLLAWLYARMTVYTITSARLVIRSGIALPMTINVPFAQVESADCKSYRDGTADLPVRVARGQNSSYMILWPNVRPWQFRRPEPMLRAVADGEQAAGVLAEALAEHAAPADDEAPRVQAAAAVDSDINERQRAIA